MRTQLILFRSVWKNSSPSILTSSYSCGLIEQLVACSPEMKMEFLSFTELWIFAASVLISAKNVSLPTVYFLFFCISPHDLI
jgi:hypothetical protein